MSKEQDDEIRTDLDFDCLKKIREIVNGDITKKQPYSSNAILRIKLILDEREKKL